MLISAQGAQALDAVGARRAADLVRKTYSDIDDDEREKRLREIILTALFELDEAGFCIAITSPGDAEFIYQAFVVPHIASLMPWISWRASSAHRIGLRNQKWIRDQFMARFLRIKDARMMALARISRPLFRAAEYDRLRKTA